MTKKSHGVQGGWQGAGCGFTLSLPPGHLDYMQRELGGGGGVHVLLQVLSEELKHHIQLFLSVDHIQQSAREESVSECGI